jgi:hypothetical protein
MDFSLMHFKTSNLAPSASAKCSHNVNELRLNNGFLFCFFVLKVNMPIYQECTVVELRTGI